MTSTTNNINISILDAKALNPGDLSWEKLCQIANIEVFDETDPSQIISRSKNAQIIIINKVQITADILDQLPLLKCIIITATGFNNVDILGAKAHKVIVCNAPNYSTNSVAQHVFAMLMNIYCKISDYANDTRKGVWTESHCFCCNNHSTAELAGKTIGIVGLGNIGAKVANIANAFGMKILSLTSKEQSELPDYIRAVNKQNLLENSDIVTLHTPLTKQTENFIDEEALKIIKHGAVVINTARGGLVCEQAVANALATKQLSAYGADVLSSEPPTDTNPLLHAPNAYITPHIAWATHEARQRLMDITINNVIAFLKNEPINIVK